MCWVLRPAAAVCGQGPALQEWGCAEPSPSPLGFGEGERSFGGCVLA